MVLPVASVICGLKQYERKSHLYERLFAKDGLEDGLGDLHLHLHYGLQIGCLEINTEMFLCFNYSSLWFAAWLSVFYCTKVASFTQSFFIWLKQRIPSLVLWMLITSSLFSFATSLPFAWDIYNVHDNFTAPLTMTNSSERRVTMKAGLFLLILLCNDGIALPLIVFVVSSILLIRSLWIHARQMQNNATGFRNPSLEAHIGAIKLVFSFLILYVTYFISFVLILSNIFLPLS
ncbi:PREDICTED: LOW QUALITY PROTEIN: taste receptor type 2 member 40-like [Aptenodytes forsteri]|uniref:LOW QUALITY PROTEIN: taste receptor type 2 member 40-like n=1 Tax=Aptenodytes forsteri TaxID=9233 RepID=UPI00090579A1|nr:PREDICTED: LOW QUALITY PROTEIN: taste receptor type 2 member 40-like [Aptenodytes forsteri]